MATLRQLAERASDVLRAVPIATRVRDNWGPESFTVRLRTDSDKANLSGLTNYDGVLGAQSDVPPFANINVERTGDEPWQNANGVMGPLRWQDPLGFQHIEDGTSRTMMAGGVAAGATIACHSVHS